MYSTTRVADLYPSTFGGRLAARREMAMAKTWAVVEATGIPEDRLAAIEADEVAPSIPEVLSLSMALDCEWTDLASSEVRGRLVLGHHGTPDMKVVDELVYYAELANFLDYHGIPAPHRA